MTRLLFVAETYHPVLGGGEKHVKDLATALVADGLAATVLTRRSRGEWPREETLDGVRVLRVAPSGPGRVGKYAMMAPLVAAMYRERRRYDVVNVCGTRVLGVPALLAAHALGKPIVLQADMTGEVSGEIYVWGTSFHRSGVLRLLTPFLALRRALLRRADALVAISRPIEGEFLSGGMPRERVVMIPHAVDTELFAPRPEAERGELRARLGLPREAQLLVFTGRLLKGKGLELLVDAFSRLATEHPEVHLLILGSGDGQTLSIEGEIHGRVEVRGLRQRVTFAGRVDNVHEYLAACDVFTFPSLFEGLPYSIVEAAASGLPVVASRVGGIPDVIADGDNGWLIEPGDETGLVGALRRLLRDAEERARMGSRSRQIALERYSMPAMTARYRALFEALAARRPPRGQG